MNVLVMFLTIALIIVVIHDIYIGRLLDKIALKYNASEKSYRNAMKIILSEYN